MNLKNTSPEKIDLRIKFPATYGRRKSRSLTDKQSQLMKEFFPQIKISPEKSDIDKFKKDSRDKQVYLEVGFGGGEHLIHQAQQNPDKIIIGCETYINTFAQCLHNIYNEKITNIRMYNNDVRYLLEALPENSIDKVFILFPDPWPKQRQFKRRIVNQQTLNLIYPVLKNGGQIRLATDIDSYFEAMLKVFLADKRFELITEPKNFTKIPADHIQTKYQTKAITAGRIPRFIEYKTLKFNIL